MQVVWSNRAEIRLRQFYQHIAQDQPENADRFLERLIDRGESLSGQALRGRQVPEYQETMIREIIEKGYRIIYQVQSERVLILTVRHCAELLPPSSQSL